MPAEEATSLSQAPQTHRIALLGAVLMLCVVSVSAYLRLSNAGLGCEPWPECFTQTKQVVGQEAQPHPIARLTHRVLASTVGVVVLLVVFGSFVRRAQRPAEFGVALMVLLLTAGLAALGRATPGSSGALISSGNLLGGLSLLALLTWLGVDVPQQVARDATKRAWRLQLFAYTALALTAIQVLAGALLSTTHSGAACPGLVACEPALASAPLHLLHRVTGVILLVLDSVLVILLLRRGGMPRILVAALTVLPIVQIGIGVAMLSTRFPLALALSHNVVAALLVATAVATVRWVARQDTALR